MNAKQIKTVRAKLGLTGGQFARQLGVTENTVRRWEMGIRAPGGPVVVLLKRLVSEAKQAKS